MFRQRLLTALVLIPLVLMAIYFANIWVLGAVVLFLVAVGGWEWTQLVPIYALRNKLIFLFFLWAALILCFYWFYDWLVIGLVLWGLILLAVVTFPASQRVWGRCVLVGSACLILLPLFATSMAAVYQYPQGRHLIVYLLCLVWATDTGAYLIGKRWGATKLIPQVSPGKTIEGALSGFLLAMVVASIGYYFLRPSSLIIWFCIAIGTALISMLGDLFISMLKRRSKIKDTGQIFPGHGGMLDRIDSLIAALPLFYCGLLFL